MIFMGAYKVEVRVLDVYFRYCGSIYFNLCIRILIHKIFNTWFAECLSRFIRVCRTEIDFRNFQALLTEFIQCMVCFDIKK